MIQLNISFIIIIIIINLILVYQRRKRQKFLADSYYQMRLEQLACLPSPEQGIVFLGDSLTQMGEWSEFFPNLLIQNRGIGGDTTTGLLKRLDVITKNNPSQIFLMIGINDICLEKKSSEEILANYRAILEYLSTYYQIKVYIQSILPVNQLGVKPFQQVNQQIIFINQELAKLAQEFNYHYINLFSYFVDANNQLNEQYTLDGIHLTGKGYLLWLKIIYSYIIRE
ncbi:MAG: G-D-S-L family lipolytic protein [Gloeocapsa sp. DLM2.Bin57]|nr:MAG: G-D-S-L family lipolytic protein [Gloeocapsa sp. DLM2.Bin57]